MNISVLTYTTTQGIVERVAKQLSVRSDFNVKEFLHGHLAKRFCVSVHANSTYIMFKFATKPSRKQISRCIKDAIASEKEYQAWHKAKFGWCRE